MPNWATFAMIDQLFEMKLFPFRQMCVTVAVMFYWQQCTAQLVDGLIGQPRSVVQVLLKPYRIIDYQKERVVHNLEEGIHQTVMFTDDTCRKFYWAVAPEKMDYFSGMLVGKGYSQNEAGNYVLDSLELSQRELPSGKAILFIATLSEKLEGNRDATGAKVKPKNEVYVEPLPRLQQAILDEERKSSGKEKKPKDPKRHWVGSRYGSTSILGWEQ